METLSEETVLAFWNQSTAFGEPVPAMWISLVFISPLGSVGLQKMASITGC